MTITSDHERVRDEILSHYDFVICGGGTAGCVIARRLSDNPDVSVLLLEAGGSDRVPAVLDTTLWMSNIGSERDWCYHAQPSPHLAGRAAPLPMGKVLGGGSSINGSIWARGHRHDFDEWARISGDPGWRYDEVLSIYRDMEDWHGPPDTARRGQNGLLSVHLPQDPIPLVQALIQATDALGIPHVNDINAEAMEGDGGCGLPNLLVRDGNERVSMAATYLRPAMERPNLHVLLCAEVTKVIFNGRRATGVQFVRRGRVHQVGAGLEVVLSLGAINTPKLLMLSGVGDRSPLGSLGLDVVQHLPGVGQNLQDHILLAGCCWQYQTPEPPRNNAAEFVFYAKSRSDLQAPDLMPVLEEAPFASDEVARRYNVPEGAASAWTLAPGLAQPSSRGQIRLASADPFAAPLIDANFLSTEEDMQAMLHCVALCREIGNSVPCAPFRQREVFPGSLNDQDMVQFIREAAGTYFHQSCTARMGTDDMAVVDGALRGHGLDGLRIADASVMPTIARGNTMAPTALIAERAARLIGNAQ